MEAQMQPLLQQLLDNMPADWRGTTFQNSALLGREKFSDNLLRLLEAKRQAPGGAQPALTEEELVALGNAEDYLRVATNLSTTLECVLAKRMGPAWGVEQVWSFASATMPFLAVALTAGDRAVQLYHGGAPAPLTPAQCEILALLGATLHCHAGSPPPAADGAVVLALEGVEGADSAHGIVGDSVLYIVDTAAIDPEDILVVRKRMATPMTTPAVEAELERLAGRDPTADSERAEPAAVAELYAHLQQLCGTAPDSDTLPQLFTAGLSALMSLWLALVARGGVDVLMCSTAYGGCSQCTDLVAERTERFRKSTFDIQGDAIIDESIATALDELAATASPLPLTVLFVEIPTNPDQKVPDTQKLIDSLEAYKQQTQKDVLLVVDTTFAPGSGILAQIEALAPELPAMVFMSMSKSVSRGKTTAGAIVANHVPEAAEVLRSIAAASKILDTAARPDQILALVKNHWGVEDRCRAAYGVTVEVGERLCTAVKSATGEDMPLAYISPEEALAGGFTSSTFSFNLPAPRGATYEVNAGLAQRYVDLLTVDQGEPGSNFKACVSFGQDNGLVYCTVPATSTQGVIAEEDKAKQARDGVQLVRLSFPPTIDVDAVCERMAAAVTAVYEGQADQVELEQAEVARL
jgi:hypothetical protein